MNNQYSNKLKESNILSNLMFEEENNFNMIKDNIRKFNKKITDIEKEKESFRNGIMLLKKHITVLNEKIKNEDQKCKEFIQNVTLFVDKSLN